jgi:hypothetical protein
MNHHFNLREMLCKFKLLVRYNFCHCKLFRYRTVLKLVTISKPKLHKSSLLIQSYTKKYKITMNIFRQQRLNLLYVEMSIRSGISGTWTANRSCTFFISSSSAGVEMKDTANPLVPNRPARPTRCFINKSKFENHRFNNEKREESPDIDRIGQGSHSW